MDSIAHRGPDGEGQSIVPLGNENFGFLGHRRLSIIDLAARQQPMESHDQRFSIVFNGEIYNYLELKDELRAKGAVFHTNCDTEVILEAWRFWGEDCLTRLRGMFAFALCDLKERRVFFARDPFGKKPLYYAPFQTSQGEGIVFGSEILALLRHPDVPQELNSSALYDYLCWRYVPAPHTFFQGIQKLLPGSLLTWQEGKWDERRYWLPPEEAPMSGPILTGDPVEAFLNVFEEAVRLRLRSDVPIGTFLSSGLDSTAVVATLRHLGISDIRTFSVGFTGDTAAELSDAAQLAQQLGTIHTPIELDTNHMVSLLPQLSLRRGAPLADPADMPIHMMSLEAGKNVKVVLSGEGADELFGGYPKHVAEQALGWMVPSGMLSLASHAFLSAEAIIPGNRKRLTIAARALKERDFSKRMVRWFGGLSSNERAAIWTGAHPSHAGANLIPFTAAKGASSLRRILHFDQTSWLPDNLLERMDRMTMAASIEGRAPFMDTHLAAFSARLPDHWRIKCRMTKRIMRTAFGNRVPQAVLERPKNGFRLPVSTWFKTELHDQFQDMMASDNAISKDFLHVAKISQIASDHHSGVQDHSKVLWSLFALETFLGEFFKEPLH